MNAMLLATTRFAAYLLMALFVGNLGLWVIRYSGAGQLGTLFSLLALAAAWFSQERYMVADQYLTQANAQATPGYVGPSNPDAWNRYSDAFRYGEVARYLCIVASVIAFVCLMLGP